MPQYKLTYFDAKGRAEISRLIFAYAGVEYEDIRIPFDPVVWKEVQTKLDPPFGSVPMLEFDGQRMCQSIAIARYLARKFGLAGKTELEQFRADMIVDCCEDITNPAIHYLFHEPDTAIQAARLKTWREESVPNWLKHLETFLKQNNGGDGYFVGDSPTYADFDLLSVVNWVEFAGIANPLANYPKLAALNDRITKLPKIAEWIAKRPQTMKC